MIDYRAQAEALAMMGSLSMTVAQIDAIEAALLAAREQGQPQWMPIETAPRDGTRVLVYIEGGGLYWRIIARTLDESGGWYTDPGKHHVQPTHWQPIPAPPEAGKATP